MDEEIWIPIDPIKYPGYEVSSHGFIRNEGGLLFDNPYVETSAYLRVRLWNVLTEQFDTHTVHMLVALVFCPNPEPDKFTYVNHKDLDKRNNRADNLEWCDHSHNMQHWADSYKAKHGRAVNAVTDEQIERLKLAGVEMTDEQLQIYLESNDSLGAVEKGWELLPGYKRCGRCGEGKKFYLFNKNSGSKTNTSGNCKECQKQSAASSYKKTKQRRNYKKYYQENKELKQAHARRYYQENKEVVKEKHKAYLQTKAGKKVMQKAHTKRRKALAENKGVPYTREMVIERDGGFIGEEHPICYLCNTGILDVSGNSLHIDHVVPVVEGGLDCFTNVASTHKECNLKREKDARTLSVEQVEAVKERAHAYIDANPDRFE